MVPPDMVIAPAEGVAEPESPLRLDTTPITDTD
jgi:hypothetical protein